MIDSTEIGSQTPGSKFKSIDAPTVKKNMTRKKSRSGFKWVAMYWAMGLVAKLTPAIKPPTSYDKPRLWASWAMVKHHPIASKKMYSWNSSNFSNKGKSTNLTTSKAPPISAGNPAAKPINAILLCSVGFPINPTKSNAMIANKSCTNNRLMTISPIWRWWSTVVGNSFMPRIVLENVMAMPTITASVTV